MPSPMPIAKSAIMHQVEGTVVLVADNDMTMFNQLINGPGFSWRDTLQLPKEGVFCRW